MSELVSSSNAGHTQCCGIPNCIEFDIHFWSRLFKLHMQKAHEQTLQTFDVFISHITNFSEFTGDTVGYKGHQSTVRGQDVLQPL